MLEASWDQPPYSGIVAYRVYYNMFAVYEMEKWASIEMGPFTVTEIGGLEAHTVYAVRVRAKLADGKWSNFSEIVVANKIENGKQIGQFSFYPCIYFLEVVILKSFTVHYN